MAKPVPGREEITVILPPDLNPGAARALQDLAQGI